MASFAGPRQPFAVTARGDLHAAMARIDGAGSACGPAQSWIEALARRSSGGNGYAAAASAGAAAAVAAASAAG